MSEAILEPDLPIIDPHHHLWDLRPLMGAFPEPVHHFISSIALSAYYTFNELHADTTSGHNIIGTVFMECGAFYKAGAGDELKVVGEVSMTDDRVAHARAAIEAAGAL
ncbi:MAG: amidohydrolase, partial [Novosphingobium sp.]